MLQQRKLLLRIDCTKEYSPDEYFCHGDVKVVVGPAGVYREAEGKPLSRFGYRFRIENTDKPHIALVRYPDDKPRFMIVNDGTSYDLSTGIQTGGSYPVSGAMHEIHQVFWARWTDCSIVFMSWGYEEPAAVESIEIYELDELPALELPPIEHRTNRRELGIQYEDPCGTGASEGAITYEKWLDRVVAYARHTGQRQLAYPICWYHGPLFPSDREPSDAFGIVVAKDRRQYCPWTYEPADWPAVLLERFEKEGLEFQGVVTLLRLGSLMKKMNTDLHAIQAGQDTINNMLFSNQVQAGTGDWTYTYNALNYEKLVEYDEQGKDKSDFPWAYGEKVGVPYHAGPLFNPLHPQVQAAVIGFVEEISRRYARFSAFKGIALSMWPATIAWFGSLHSGYDDYTVALFEEETGIKIPVDRKDPERFSKRYEFLVFNCRRAWINWRCVKVKQLIGKMRDALTSHRSDLVLTLNLWSETFIPAIVGGGGSEHQIGARASTAELYRQAGLDLDMFQGESNIRFDLQLEGGGRDRSATNVQDVGLEHLCMFRDHDFLDQATLDEVGKQARPGVFIFNAWHEAWGTHKWFKHDQNDTQAEELACIYGKKAEGIFRINSEYPKDGFWWDSQLRITHAFPPEPHFMEQYAHAVAELDACRITRGGLFLDKAHSQQLRQFAKAFCELPSKKFETVGTETDPIAVRQCVSEGRRYFYLVNREYYPVEVAIVFRQPPRGLIDLASGENVVAVEKWNLTLGAYELRTFVVENESEIVEKNINPPSEIEASLIQDAHTALECIRKVADMGKLVVGMEELALQIQTAMELRRLAWLRRAMSSYIVRKCRQILST